MAKSSLLRLKNVSKFYYNKGVVASGFTKVNLELNLGEFVVITGESGSGKSTLLNVLSGLDSYEEGEMYINGEETSHYSEEDFESYRKTYIGNIFQSFNLVNSYSVYENIELVLLLNGYNKKDIKSKILELIDKVGLKKYLHTKVSKLSGGQKQRVAIARALAKDTPIIIADEPTGNLDSNASKSVIKLLAEVAKDKLVIIVTHNYDQVKDYATRKLEMHDGKLREDTVIKETSSIKPSLYEYKDLSFDNKIKLGFRNTFNIFGKFILTFIVFFLIIMTFISEYSGIKSSDAEGLATGYNSYFTKSDVKRIVIKKNNNKAFNIDEYEKISKIDHVKNIIQDDSLTDVFYTIADKNYYFSLRGSIENINELDYVDEGRLPENDYEIVVLLSKDFGYNPDDYLNKKVNLTNNNGTKLFLENDFTIVGYKVSDEYLNEGVIYVTDNIFYEVSLDAKKYYSNNTFILENNTYDLNDYDYILLPNANVEKGNAYIYQNINNLCTDNNCINKTLNIYTSNIYYSNNINLTITQSFTNKNIYNLLNIDNNDEERNVIFISPDDYKTLYDNPNYQISIFVDEEYNVESVNQELQKLGYKTLVIKDNLKNDLETLQAVLRIIRLVVFIGLFIFLFFIAYFVIKLIQKSKNVYYVTVRILGGSKKIIKDLIRAELLTVFNIAFIISSVLIFLLKKGIIKTTLFENVIKYIFLKDFIFIYIVLTLMSLLIANRYSRKLFKSSAMKSYKEEV